MKRRDFIEQAAIVGTGAMILAPGCTESSSLRPKYKMGYQLFSIRDEMAKDPLATLKALMDMGYQDFETFGYKAEEDTFYGYKSADFKKVLDELQITTSSGHFGFSDYFNAAPEAMQRFVDQCIAGAKAVNMKYITWPWLDPALRTMENYKLMCPKLNSIGEQVTKAGLGFAYHNHGFEFDDHNGAIGYDLIMKETDPALVKLQMDMYWVMHSSKFTPAELIKRQPGRFVMWHIKDMDKVSRDYTELGNGSIDYLKLLPDPKTSGLEYYFIEQGGNFAHNSMRSAADSASYFKKNLQQFL